MSEYIAIPVYQTRLQPIENWLTTEKLDKLLTEAGFRIHRHEGRPAYEFPKVFMVCYKCRFSGDYLSYLS